MDFQTGCIPAFCPTFDGIPIPALSIYVPAHKPSARDFWNRRQISIAHHCLSNGVDTMIYPYQYCSQYATWLGQTKPAKLTNMHYQPFTGIVPSTETPESLPYDLQAVQVMINLQNNIPLLSVGRARNIQTKCSPFRFIDSDNANYVQISCQQLSA